MLKRAFALVSLSYLAFTAGFGQSPASSIANLEKMIGHYKEVEATQTKLMAEISRGAVVMLKFPELRQWYPVRTDEFRSRFVHSEMVAELAKARPDLEAALKRGNDMASKHIRSRKADGEAYVNKLNGELSKIRTVRQKAERQLEQLTKQPAPPEVVKGGTFAGTWDSDWKKMTLTQAGSHVSGTYEHLDGKIEGDVGADGVLHFKWTQSNAKGIGEFKLSADGQSISGTWNYTNDQGEVGSGGRWGATRAKGTPAFTEIIFLR